MQDPHQKLENMEDELMDIEMCLQTAQWECRENLLNRRRNLFTSIQRLNEKIGRDGDQRRYVEEDNRHW